MRGPAHNDAAEAGFPPPEVEEIETSPEGWAARLAWAVAAAVAAGLLAWWLTAQPDRSLTLANVDRSAPPADIPPAQERLFAASRPNPEQVRRALAQVQAAYADGGAPAVASFTRTCAESLRAGPRVLDFCLAADVYGSALAKPARGQREAAARDRLALARAALPPGSDAAARVKAVEALTGISQPSPTSAARPRPARAHPRAAAGAGIPCRLRSTPAERALCASPRLRAAERRMRAAYARALARGANRRRLAREQAVWQVKLNAAASDPAAAARLYDSRARELARAGARE